MKRCFLLIFILWIFGSCLRSQSPGTVSESDCILEPADKEIFEKIKNRFGDARSKDPGELVLAIGRFFLETPYVAHTLEKGDTEKLVVNLRELDCTTYAENCLALARSLRLKNPGFVDFLRELRFIRYRDGKIDGYPSRLHYFSDWISDNDRKGTVESLSKDIAHTLVPKKINFMSRHTTSYPILQRVPGFIPVIAAQETEISNRMTWFIPENRLAVVENKIKDGDIIGITTNIEGMDISHVVLAVRLNGRIRFIHASSKEMKVVISEETLEEYLMNSKMASGIMVARPL
jgi:hypothetical protein